MKKLTAVSSLFLIILAACGGGDLAISGTTDPLASHPANFSGNIYSRTHSTFSNSIDVYSTPLADATISLGTQTINADGMGNFVGTVPTVVLASDTVNITKSGYIPINIARSLIDSASTNIGLYSTSSVNSRPGFIGGVFTMDAGGYLNMIYKRNLFNSTYDRIKTQTGANLVASSDPVWVESYDVQAGTVSMSSTSQIPMMTRQQYTTLVGLAHSQNMQYMMQLGVYPAGSLQMPWTVPANNTVFWTAWFAAYKEIVIQYAQIATDLNIEYISLGMNHGFMSALPVSYWSDLVISVRNTGYTGKIVYQAMMKPGVWSETDGFNTAATGNLTTRQKNLQFVKLFDYIVLDIYNIVGNADSNTSAPRSDMRKSFATMLHSFTDYPVPLMVQIGTPSIRGGSVITDYVEPCIVCVSIAPTKTMDLMEQADVYQTIGEVINATPTGNGNVMGLISWGYWFTDNFRTNVTRKSTGINSDGTLVDSTVAIGNQNLISAYDKSASIRGKPAESVFGWWINKFAQ